MALLGVDRVGRLAVVDGFSPVVFRVNYAMDGDDIVFRVADGTKLRSVGRANACFEIDAFDPDRRSGWSVVVVGRLEEVTPLDPAYERTIRLPLDPWAEGDRRYLLRLVASRVTGRRVGGAM
jgi:nitroimidazol reductase NimA-like FMN-containing flavoprotein (pyridoxamine 5'-phosphate oxidase superfamily)